MKMVFVLLRVSFCFLCLLSFQNSQEQLLKRLKDEVKSRAENKIVNKAGNTTDKAIDKAVDGVTGKNEKNAKNGSSSAKTETNTVDANATEIKSSNATFTSYKNFDFVPGDKIIFEPDLTDEPDAELPARFSVLKGNAEIQTFEGDKILHLQADGDATVSPLMNSNDYLPEQFTLEFDVMYENNRSYFAYVSDFDVLFRTPDDKDHFYGSLYDFKIDGTSRAKFGEHSAGLTTFPEPLKKSFSIGNTWHHISIYVRKNIGKAYIDGYRVCATNTLPVGAGRVLIKADRYGVKIKSFRLAAGGDDKYKKIVTDGKFVTHGISFDVNKSSIKPESMGTLNEVAKMMKEHADLRFEITGHTDSDGNDDANMKLSQSRADAVKDKLVEMGIDASRLTTKGFGETKPIDTNNSAEGKANNRRVEFVKI